MGFRLELATYEDIDTLLDVYFHAFENDGVYKYIYPGLVGCVLGFFVVLRL
jgi:hypothetical protein